MEFLHANGVININLKQPNAQLILCNHEAMLLSCDFVFEENTNESIDNFTKEKMKLLMDYTQNGGDVTLKALKSLIQTEPDTLTDILDYLLTLTINLHFHVSVCNHNITLHNSTG